MNAPVSQDKFRAYRERKKAAGLREVRLWVPDTRSTAFKAEATRQAALLNHSEDEKEAIAAMERLAHDVLDDWH
ncbi:antitoxin MazE-like protein [Sphingomonas sp.]|uniref:antitoxin MazE-like protein n=1 Tax=Sphingomonas sp. TaxID=28214 RepID=UPI003B00C2F0